MRATVALLAFAACASSGVASAQAPLRGDFDGDGKPDAVLVLPVAGADHERVHIVVQLAARPGESFFLASGPAASTRSVEILPPGAYQVGTGRAMRELALTADSVKITTEPPGQPARTMLKYWDPDIPAFAGSFLAN